jgi:hypothetical protein
MGQLEVMSDTERHFTLDTNEYGCDELANGVLGRVEKTLWSENGNGISLTTQIDVRKPVAQSPVPDSVVGRARPSRPQAVGYLVVMQPSPVHV